MKFFIYNWVYFISYSFWLKCSLCTSTVFPNSFNIFTISALNFLSDRLFISVLFFKVFLLLFLFFTFLFISWRLITLKYCSGFCHTLTCISHGFTCVRHLDPPSHLTLHPIPLGLPSVPALTKQKKRHRCTEQTFSLCGRR